jgi:ABC-type dipeptide/oligopeptide/nickel transport system permease subunit
MSLADLEANADVRPIPEKEPRKRGRWRSVLPWSVLTVLVVLAAFGWLLAPYDPNSQDIASRLLPPMWNAGGSSEHVLGTDQLGRDLLSLLLAGAQVSLIVAACAAVIEAVVGLTVGIVAGYFGGRVERVLMQWTEIQMGFPILLIFMVVVLTFGHSLPVIILALALNGWMIFARVGRTAVRSLRAQGFVEAAIGIGASPRWVMFRHILPHLRGQIVTLLLLEMARLILAESGASFLGLGVQPPLVSWGLVLGSSRDYIPVAYNLAVFPGLAIVLAVLGLNLLSQRATDRLERSGRGR